MVLSNQLGLRVRRREALDKIRVASLFELGDADVVPGARLVALGCHLNDHLDLLVAEVILALGVAAQGAVSGMLCFTPPIELRLTDRTEVEAIADGRIFRVINELHVTLHC